MVAQHNECGDRKKKKYTNGKLSASFADMLGFARTDAEMWNKTGYIKQTNWRKADTINWNGK